ncbi:C-C motif chemokine 3-like isoform X1 [Rhinopithecus roxellana]|uniref:C-C motif chemokine 3-like isoform X1 n=1 Tax=Rhinopithecus roxellana TaxID=61622 RepID=UPI0012374BDD|nr:C-C motif chemokine 3-like isoform X1 [Rhinopithecus roxellana]
MASDFRRTQAAESGHSLLGCADTRAHIPSPAQNHAGLHCCPCHPPLHRGSLQAGLLCTTYISRQIPQNFIADYFETSSQCSKPSVIFLTKRDRQVCANPSEEWVQKYVSDLELSA